MAAVVTRVAKHEEPGKFLARHFCKDRWKTAPLNRPEEFALHAHKKFRLGDKIDVNSWVRNEAATMSIDNVTHRAVLVLQDLNTLAEPADKADLSRDDVIRFYELVCIEPDKILAL